MAEIVKPNQRSALYVRPAGELARFGAGHVRLEATKPDGARLIFCRVAVTEIGDFFAVIAQKPGRLGRIRHDFAFRLFQILVWARIIA